MKRKDQLAAWRSQQLSQLRATLIATRKDQNRNKKDIARLMTIKREQELLQDNE